MSARLEHAVSIQSAPTLSRQILASSASAPKVGLVLTTRHSRAIATRMLTRASTIHAKRQKRARTCQDQSRTQLLDASVMMQTHVLSSRAKKMLFVQTQTTARTMFQGELVNAWMVSKQLLMPQIPPRVGQALSSLPPPRPLRLKNRRSKVPELKVQL